MFLGHFKGPCLFKQEKWFQLLGPKEGVCFEEVHVTIKLAPRLSIAVQSMYLHAPCRLCTHKECIKTKILYNPFSTSYASCQYMPVPFSCPCGYICRGGRGVCLKYTPFTFLAHVRANLVPVSSLALPQCNNAHICPSSGPLLAS